MFYRLSVRISLYVTVGLLLFIVLLYRLQTFAVQYCSAAHRLRTTNRPTRTRLNLPTNL